MSRRQCAAGCSIVDALVATTLAGIALASLALAGAVGRRGLVQARETAVALALAGERLEALRAGPRADGSDLLVAAGGTSFARQWTVADGRGNPTALRVEVRWRERELALSTEVPP